MSCATDRAHSLDAAENVDALYEVAVVFVEGAGTDANDANDMTDWVVEYVEDDVAGYAANFADFYQPTFLLAYYTRNVPYYVHLQ